MKGFYNKKIIILMNKSYKGINKKSKKKIMKSNKSN